MKKMIVIVLLIAIYCSSCETLKRTNGSNQIDMNSIVIHGDLIINLESSDSAQDGLGLDTALDGNNVDVGAL